MSQVLPHKRTELAIATSYLLKTIYDINFGLVIAGAQRNRNYLSSLETFAGRLGLSDVWFIGEVNEKELLTLYQSASFFLGTSDHEGLSIPPLEAMANGLACVVRGCGAVAETVGDGAIVLDSNSGAVELAAAVSTLFKDKYAQARLRTNGRTKISEIERQQPEKLFCELLLELQK
jgi:glycosyltransferase involved in cell wall biosynthesis